VFVTNDKGSSWAYSTPGFGAPLAPALLKELREMARVPEQSRFYTEVPAPAFTMRPPPRPTRAALPVAAARRRRHRAAWAGAEHGDRAGRQQ
jgi:hypothetical protein